MHSLNQSRSGWLFPASLAIAAGLVQMPPAIAQPDVTPPPTSGVANGGFEAGNAGWMWEQWSGKPFPGTIDKADAVEGKVSFKFGVPGAEGGRYFAKEIPVPDAGKDYVLSFALKLDNVPEGAARFRLAVPDKGFLRGGDLVRSGGTAAWKTYKYPVTSADLGGAKKVTIFLYHDQVGSGIIGFDALAFVPGTLAAGEASPMPGAAPPAAKGTSLTGTTSRPDISTFALGEKITLNFAVSDMKPGAEPVRLQVSVVDEHGTAVENRELPVQADAAGAWTGQMEAAASRLGFYKVNARLSNGVPLQAEGSRAPGFLTYAVVPDPATRKDYGEKDTRFGMQGGFGPWRDKVLSFLGARWVLDGSLEWRRTEPDRAGQFRAGMVQGDAVPPVWKTYSLPTLYAAPKWAVVPETLAYMTGTLTPEGEKAWDVYCRAAARSYMGSNPGRTENVYQITWEPIRSWGFKGTDSDLVRIYEIAYKAIHETDPKAVVAGPTRGINNNDPQKQVSLFKLGLGKYLDAYSTHPYHNINPERDGMVNDARSVKTILRNFGKPDLPMLGTEQGLSTEEDPGKDLDHARGLIRQNLITLGEGYRFNMAFYVADYRLAGQKGYGYYYTLDQDVPFGPKRISPRPIVPAYAAQSLLLDGSESAGAIEWLGETAWGYAFQRGADTTLALWDYGKARREVSLPVGADTVRIFDWMGNPRDVKTQAGTLTLELGPEPIYVTKVSTRIWGRGAEKVLTAAKTEVTAYPGTVAPVVGGALLPGPGMPAAQVELQADAKLGLAATTKGVKLGANSRTPFTFDVAVPATARPGAYPVRLTLRDAAGHTLAAAGVSLKVVSPVAVSGVRPVALASGQTAISLALHDERGQGMTGTVELHLKEVLPGAARADLPMIDLVEDPAKTREVEGSTRELPFKLEAGGSQTLTLDIPQLALSPCKTYQAVTTVKLASGYRFVETAPVNFLSASPLAVSTVDGDLGDWAAVAPIELAGKEAVIRNPNQYKGDGDLAAKWRFAWDARALYLTAEVRDDAFYQMGLGGDTWKGDSLQLAFDMDARHDVPDDARRHTELNVALTTQGPQVFRSLTFDMAKLPSDLVPADRLPRAIRRADGITTYELAIPWRELGADGPPKDGFLGFGATVNDADGAEDSDPMALGLYGGIHPDKEPSKLGVLALRPGK